MLNSTRQLIVAGLAVGLLAAAAGVRADTSSQSFNIAAQSSPFAAQDIGFNLFNSNLGSLTSVTLQLVVTGEADITITDNNISSITTPDAYTNAFTSFPMSITGPPGSTLYISTPGPSGAISSSSASGSVFFGPTFIPGPTETYNSGIVGVASADWGSFEAPGDGPSTFPLIFNGGTFTSGIDAPQGVGISGSGTLGGTSPSLTPGANNTLTITYNYNPAVTGTPEPGSWALFVAASVSASLAGIRRRRNRKAA